MAFSGPRRRIVDLDMRNFKRLAADLEKFARSAVPHAARNALNETAFEARHEYIEAAREMMTIRNRFTERTIGVQTAKGVDLKKMESRTGSTQEYMREREFGGTEHKHGKHGVPIPTPTAAGQAMGTQPRTRVVKRANLLSNIQLNPAKLRNASSANTRRQRNAVALRLAAKSGKYAFLELQRHKGIFKVTGTKRLNVRMVWDLSKPSVTTRPLPMLMTAVFRVSTRVRSIHAAAIVEQLRRRRILHYAGRAQYGY